MSAVRSRHRLRRHAGEAATGSNNFPYLRIKELLRIFADRYRSDRLPDDDAGREDLRLLLDHAAQVSPELARKWAMRLIPELDDDDSLDELLKRVGAGRRWAADDLARAVGLDDARRTRLEIRTIGAVDYNKTKRKARRRRKRIAADRARRAKAGAAPRTQSAERTRPWEAEGISRRTWYRRRQNGTVGTDTRPQGRRPTVDATTNAKAGSPLPKPSPTRCRANLPQQVPASEVSPSFPTERVASAGLEIVTSDHAAREMRAAVKQASAMYLTCAASNDAGASSVAAATLAACMRAERALHGEMTR